MPKAWFIWRVDKVSVFTFPPPISLSSSKHTSTTPSKMATATQTAPQTPSAPQITVLHRVASIPLVSDSLAAVHATLSGNTYLKHPYTTAYALSSAMMRASEPVQARLAPVIVRADGFANKAVDAVESRYPYPFHAPTEEIYGTLRQHSEHAYGVANKTIDNRVRTPAYGFAHGIDQVRQFWSLHF